MISVTTTKINKPLDQNVDIEYVDKISSFIRECSPDNAPHQDSYTNGITSAPMIKTELEQVLRKAKSGTSINRYFSESLETIQ